MAASNPLPTPVKAFKLAHYLHGYDLRLKSFLLQGFQQGFRIGYLGERVGRFSHNLKSALEASETVSRKLEKEVALGRMAGPFEAEPFPQFVVNPIGLVPKKQPGEYRMIHHLSFPQGSSINDGIPQEFSSVSYATIQDAIDSIVDMQGPVYLGKCDILSAFRQIPVNPADYPLLGCYWQGKFYFDKCLEMGASSSCMIFEKVSTALEWIAKDQFPGVHWHHVLDDFLCIGASEEACRDALLGFIAICEEIGMPMAPDKTMGPERVLPFLGITLDTVCKEARLPPDKLTRCREEISIMLRKSRVKLRELQSLLGLLNFACSVILPGRPFLRRLIDLTMGVTKGYHHIRLSAESKQDLALWLSFLEGFNGRSFFHGRQWETSHFLKLYTDSAASLGFAGVYGNQWFQGRWPEHWKSYSIQVLEFFPIVAALYVWGDSWRNKNVLFLSDNQSLVHVLNKQSSKDKPTMFLMRKLVLKCLQLNTCFRAQHIPGVFNNVADCLSRFQTDRLWEWLPTAKRLPCMLPHEICPENLVNMPANC